MSFNDPEKIKAWTTDQEFPFEVWSDRDKTLAQALGAGGRFSVVPSRVSFVLDASGKVVLEYRDVKVGTHPEDVLLDCRALFGGGP